MQILAHGIDLVELPKFNQRLSLYETDGLLGELFTANELGLAGSGVNRNAHLAGRFAAKEAVLKALGTGWVDGISWTDVEILRNSAGAPTVLLHDECVAIAARVGITGWLISISHTDQAVVASAMGVSGVPNP